MLNNDHSTPRPSKRTPKGNYPEEVAFVNALKAANAAGEQLLEAHNANMPDDGECQCQMCHDTRGSLYNLETAEGWATTNLIGTDASWEMGLHLLPSPLATPEEAAGHQYRTIADLTPDEAHELLGNMPGRVLVAAAA